MMFVRRKAMRLLAKRNGRSAKTIPPKIVRLSVFALVLIGAAGATKSDYDTENAAAMERMMAAMHVHPSGDADADFVAMMVPHHQGAIDMALVELKYGRNERLRRLAQEIIVEQQQEIAVMRLALGQPLPPSVAAPTNPAALTHGGMTMKDDK